jgi:aminoglycoside phosphotransferase (APT) family kinase protein
VSETRAVRAGDEVDLDALNAWIATYAEEVGTVNAIEQFPGGFSNLTYLLKTDRGEFVLRRPPLGAAKGAAHDMAREYRVLSVLASRSIPAPRPIGLCDNAVLLGTPFYLMERVRGTILRSTSGAAPGAYTMRRLSEAFVETLASIHSLDASDSAIAELGKPEGYVARQVGGWSKRWDASRTNDVPAMESTARWLASHQPPESGAACLVHNDFKYDNLVLDAGDNSKIVAVLDWEMAALGDPLLDVGTSLGYWVEAGDHPAFRSLGLGVTSLQGNFTRAELWEKYLQRTRRPATDPAFYYAFGLFKIAVIAQQIFARYRKGLTTDERFARLGDAVQLLAATAERTIKTGVISATS